MLFFVQINGGNISDAFREQVINYKVTTSLFDLVAAAAIRFFILIFFYAILYINHWIVIAVSFIYIKIRLHLIINQFLNIAYYNSFVCFSDKQSVYLHMASCSTASISSSVDNYIIYSQLGRSLVPRLQSHTTGALC